MSEAKKIKLSADFTERGRFSDEITLKFDDGKKLFVSKSFLCMTSPVFDAMLTRDFKEKTTCTITMGGKYSDDFLEFLQCIHPAIVAPVTVNSMLNIAHLAEEYQHDVLILSCKELMKTSLNKAYACHLKTDQNKSTKWKSINHVTWMLLILQTSSELNYDAIKQLAIEYLGKCSYVYYYGSKWFHGCPLPEDAKKNHTQTKGIYQELPQSLKNEVLLQRLGNIDC